MSLILLIILKLFQGGSQTLKILSSKLGERFSGQTYNINVNLEEPFCLIWRFISFSCKLARLRVVHPPLSHQKLLFIS